MEHLPDISRTLDLTSRARIRSLVPNSFLAKKLNLNTSSGNNKEDTPFFSKIRVGLFAGFPRVCSPSPPHHVRALIPSLLLVLLHRNLLMSSWKNLLTDHDTELWYGVVEVTITVSNGGLIRHFTFLWDCGLFIFQHEQENYFSNERRTKRNYYRRWYWCYGMHSINFTNHKEPQPTPFEFDPEEKSLGKHKGFTAFIQENEFVLLNAKSSDTDGLITDNTLIHSASSSWIDWLGGYTLKERNKKKGADTREESKLD